MPVLDPEPQAAMDERAAMGSQAAKEPAEAAPEAPDVGTQMRSLSLVSIKPLTTPRAGEPDFRQPASGRTVGAGSDAVLGATITPAGINFAVASRHATGVYLVLFDAPDGPATDVIPLRRTGDVWHVHVEGLRKGQLYGYRADGPFDPAHGLRFNPHKLLADPYAKAFTGKFVNADNLLLAYDCRAEGKDLTLDTRDNAAVVPRCVAWDDAFDWGEDARPGLPKEQLVIYEVHVKGFTAHPSSGVRHPGTYLGFIEKIPYLKELGVNAVELLPVHESVCEDVLRERGLANYWGYNTIGFFAPESAYAADKSPGAAIDEFKTLVRELHRAGIEVILDVVYNHTAEGNECGPTLSFRGLDNKGYYSLCGDEAAPLRHYRNYSGTGNTLTASSPLVQRLVLDSLRYWAEVMHVDGFRFDLAACLGRDRDGGFSACGHLLGAIAADPVLGKLRLIAEPWDLEAYEVGGMPAGWSEWNGKFRDCFRKFGKGDPGQLPEVGRRVSGSPDLFAHNGRCASDSVNFLTCHDGFTLYDLVAYDGKHNEANGEDNRDGADDNNSWNCGAEGDTDDAGIEALRRRQARNFFCYQMLSVGTPMITAGDEFLRTQRGNNNVYAQDNELSWMDWGRCAANGEMVDFVRKLLRYRRDRPALQRLRFLQGEDRSGDGVPDVHWVGPGTGEVRWDDPEQRCLGFQVDGAEPACDGQCGGDYRLFVVFNADSETRSFGLPQPGEGRRWYRVIDTGLPPGEDILGAGRGVPVSDPAYLVGPRSCIVLETGKERPA